MKAALRSVIRWSGSLLLGLVIVYILAVAGLHAFGWFDDFGLFNGGHDAARRTQVVDLLSEVERVQVRKELGLDQRRIRETPAPPQPLRVPHRVSGFVQLEIEVGAGGEVVNARVLGAVPEGYYEEQALELVQQRAYEPAPLGTYRITEVVPFSLTVEEPVDGQAPR